MRIIAGSARSLPLKTVDGMDTRPTMDKIKETLFNIIQWDLQDACFLDLFAGCGGIGLEALSRGAAKAVFVDVSRRAIACIKENIAFTGFGSRSVVLNRDFRVALDTMRGRYRFDIIYMDPPYGKGMAAEALKIMDGAGLVADDGIIIVEESLEFEPVSLETVGFTIYRVKRYKTNQHIFLRKREADLQASPGTTLPVR
ncbi:MAG: 16S rRNA (guanine(966)-N(2))-methyltransferase RsmD [Clostridiales bacterium]|nr:16S rRNA (guanine(966)-N(2))-methyltransferase RsmD [Clostridiales bacterium]